MSVIDNSNLGTLWNRILGLFSARKINNKSLAKDITINDEDIPSTAINGETTVEGALGNIADQLSNQSRQIDGLQAAAAYVEDGDVATKKTYSEGEFIIWKGLLYRVNSGGLPSGEAISGHVTKVTDGGFNVLNDGLNSLSSNLGNVKIVRVSKFVTIQAGPITTNIDLSEYIPSEKSIVGIPTAMLGKYVLPYVDNGVLKTFIEHVKNKSIDIYNSSSDWNNYNLQLVLFIA